MGFFDFNQALVRTPARSVVDGLRAIDASTPSHDGVVAEQRVYVRALEQAGCSVATLPPLEAFPDSVFVEDAALVFTGAAIVLRPGAPSRRDEALVIAPELERRFERVLRLERGTVDGGDVLTTPRGVYIGVSARTSAEGAEALCALLEEIDQRGIVAATPPGVLHFKSDCALIDEETVIATASLAASGVLDGFETVVALAGEEGAANLIRVGDRLLVSAAYPRTAELLTKRGHAVVPLATAEIAKIDAGLSCMSLRWRACITN